MSPTAAKKPRNKPAAAKIAAPPSFFLPYQAKWIRDNSRLKLMEKARQIGISWSSAYEDVRQTSPQDAIADTWVSSRDEIQARLYLEDCKAFAKILNTAAEDLGEVIIDPSRRLSAMALRFANGKTIYSMSSNPDAQAGKRGNRKLDEFALHPDPRQLYSIAYHGITWGGSLAIISTHRGSANYFNSLITDVKHKGNPKGFSLHTVTLQDALDQGFLSKLQAKLPPDDERQEMDEADYFNFIKAGCADDESFNQECMCIAADDNSAFISYDLIQGNLYTPGDPWEWALADFQTCKDPLYAGLDIGRANDLTAFWIFQVVNGSWFLRKRIELQNVCFADQEACIYPYLELPTLRRACFDQTGLGRQFTERAQARFGTYKIEGVTFTGPAKEEMAYPVRSAFEDKILKIPDDRFVIADLRSIKKETTASGNIRFTADRGANGHSDRFWALALAMHAGKQTNAASMPVPFASAYSRTNLNRRNRSLLG
jgi:phage FluMu gp28-like protein